MLILGRSYRPIDPSNVVAAPFGAAIGGPTFGVVRELHELFTLSESGKRPFRRSQGAQPSRTSSEDVSARQRFGHVSVSLSQRLMAYCECEFVPRLDAVGPYARSEQRYREPSES